MDSELYCKLFVYIHIDIITCWEKNIIIVIITTFQTSDLLIDQIKNVILANERKEISLTESLKENYIAKAKAVAYIIDNIPAYEGVNILVFMERGIYEDCTRMYAPYYKQGAMKIYGIDRDDREQHLQTAYRDISSAFSYYLENENNGRPIVLAGFSQGADMCYRLLEEYFGDEDLYDRLVAVYAIGWPCDKELVKKYPQIKPATSADDIGTVVSFDCEADDVTGTFIYPEDVKAYTIN